MSETSGNGSSKRNKEEKELEDASISVKDLKNDMPKVLVETIKNVSPSCDVIVPTDEEIMVSTEVIATTDAENENENNGHGEGLLGETDKQSESPSASRSSNGTEGTFCSPHSPRLHLQTPRSLLKRPAENDKCNKAINPKRRKSITFDIVKVFYFPRTEEFNPSSEGSPVTPATGMAYHHEYVRKFSLADSAAGLSEQERFDKEMVVKIKREQEQELKKLLAAYDPKLTLSSMIQNDSLGDPVTETKMALKRKASSPPEMNGDDNHNHNTFNGQIGVFTLPSTPKRSFPTKSPNKLDFNSANNKDDIDTVLREVLCAGRPKIANGIRALNEVFVQHCQTIMETKPESVLIPAFVEYEEHITDLLDEIITSEMASKGLTGEKKYAIRKLLSESLQEAKGSGSVPEQLNSTSKVETNPCSKNNKVNSNSLVRPIASTSSNTPKDNPFEGFRFVSKNQTAATSNSPVTPRSDKVTAPSTVTDKAPVTSVTNSTNKPWTNPSGLNSHSNGFLPHFPGLSKFPSPSKTTSGAKEVESLTDTRSVPEPPKSTFTFSFARPPPNPSDSNAEDSKANKEEEDDEPPKNEFTKVEEKDAVYSVRCKIFGMVGGAFKDKGVGQLYVKKSEDGKHFFVVRADNSLGQIILTVLLKEELPLQKKSAKDVMTVDPLGDNGKPMTVLIRVKSEEAATELLDKLREFAKKSS